MPARRPINAPITGKYARPRRSPGVPSAVATGRTVRNAIAERSERMLMARSPRRTAQLDPAASHHEKRSLGTLGKAGVHRPEHIAERAREIVDRHDPQADFVADDDPPTPHHIFRNLVGRSFDRFGADAVSK